jgi:hypothetical protein
MPKSKILIFEDMIYTQVMASSSKQGENDISSIPYIKRFKEIGSSRVILAELLELIQKS